MNTKKSKIPLPLRTVLFDYGGVIADEGFRQGLEVIALQNGHEPLTFFCFVQKTLFSSGYIIGHCSEAKFWETVRKGSPLGNKSDAMYRQEILDRFRLRPQMITLVKALRSLGIITAILSDQTNWLDMLEVRDHFFHEFDYVFNSYHLGKSKHDPSIFNDVLQTLGVLPQKALFVDNDPENTKRATSRGLHTIVYRDYKNFIKELETFLSFRLHID